jgi:hypothetical protein
MRRNGVLVSRELVSGLWTGVPVYDPDRDRTLVWDSPSQAIDGIQTEA